MGVVDKIDPAWRIGRGERFCSFLGQREAFAIVDGDEMLYIPMDNNEKLDQFTRDHVVKAQRMSGSYPKAMLALSEEFTEAYGSEVRMKMIPNFDKDIIKFFRNKLTQK